MLSLINVYTMTKTSMLKGVTHVVNDQSAKNAKRKLLKVLHVFLWMRSQRGMSREMLSQYHFYLHLINYLIRQMKPSWNHNLIPVLIEYMYQTGYTYNSFYIHMLYNNIFHSSPSKFIQEIYLWIFWSTKLSPYYTKHITLHINPEIGENLKRL